MKLENRGISGKKCLACCERQRELTELTVRGFLGNLLNRIIEIGEPGDENMVLAWIPVIKPPFIYPPGGPRIFPIERGRPLPKGAVILVGAIVLAAFLARMAAIALMRSIIDSLDYVLPSDCSRCVRQGLWSQSNPQLVEDCPNGTRLVRTP